MNLDIWSENFPPMFWSKTSLLLTTVILLVVSEETANQAPPVLRPGARPDESVAPGTREFLLTCPVDSSDSLLLVEWTKDGEAIGPGWLRHKTTSSGALRIKNVKLEDTGIYQCKAVNGYGTVMFTFRLKVTAKEPGAQVEDLEIIRLKRDKDDDLDPNMRRDEAPYWKDQVYMHAMTQNRVIRKQVGNSIVLKCEAGGYPLPDIQWKKDGNVIKENWIGEWTLDLSNLVESDSGRYTCRASNIFGRRNATFVLEVSRYQSTDDNVPRFDSGLPRNVTVPIGRDAHLECRVRSTMEVRIQWLRQVNERNRLSKQQVFPVNGNNYSVVENYPNTTGRAASNIWYNELILPKVTDGHSGWYVCVVATANHVIYQRAFVKVEKKIPVHVIFGVCAVALFLVVTISAGIWLCRRRHTAASKMLNKSAGGSSNGSAKAARDPERSPAKTYPTMITYPSPRPYSKSSGHSKEVAFRPSPLGMHDPHSTVPLNPSLASASDSGDNHYEASLAPYPSNYDHYEPLCQHLPVDPHPEPPYGPPYNSRQPSELIYPPLHGKRS